MRSLHRTPPYISGDNEMLEAPHPNVAISARNTTRGLHQRHAFTTPI